MNCQVKKGIFVLKECGEIAGIKCDSCGINICSKHGKQDGPKILCAECYTKLHEKELNPAGRNKLYEQWEDSSSTNYMLWYFATRYSFYGSSHYSPFDSHDYNSFNNHSQNDFTDDKDTGSFMDS